MSLWLFLLLLSSPPDGTDAARSALQAVAKKHDAVATMRADYVQERSTALMKKPLTTKGELFFRKKPGCLLLKAKKKRGSIIRIDEKKYEIYRPRRKKLERFSIVDQEWSHALFQTFAQRVDELEKYFDIKGSKKVEGGLAVVLEPKERKENSVRDLTLTIDTKETVVRSVSYTAASGDEVTIRLENVEIDPTLEDGTFDLVPAEGTQIIVH